MLSIDPEKAAKNKRTIFVFSTLYPIFKIRLQLKENRNVKRLYLKLTGKLPSSGY